MLCAIVFSLIPAGRSSFGMGWGLNQRILYLSHPYAAYRVSISYYACNWSKSLWWCGGCGVVVVRWLKLILVFRLARAEQFHWKCNMFSPLDWIKVIYLMNSIVLAWMPTNSSIRNMWLFRGRSHI